MRRLLSRTLALALCVGLWVAPAEAYTTARPGARQVLDACYHYSGYIDPSGGLWLSSAAGDGSFSKRMDDVASFSCGDGSVAAIKTDASLWVWGSNTYGDVGIGTQEPVTAPVKVMDAVSTASCSTSATSRFIAAIKTDGSLWMWGGNYYGQLGNGKYGFDSTGYGVQSAVPVKVMDGVAAVSCGDDFVAAIKTDGSLWMWGNNRYGQLGSDRCDQALPDGSKLVTKPRKVMDNVAAVSCGSQFAGAVKKDSSLWMWGKNTVGEVGAGTDRDFYDRPVKIMDHVDHITCGAYHSFAVQADGSIWTWGRHTQSSIFALELSNDGTLHENGEKRSEIITAPKRLTESAEQIYALSSASAIVKSDGSLWTWGDNYHSNLGYPDGDYSYTEKWHLGFGYSGGSSSSESQQLRYHQTVPRKVDHAVVKTPAASAAKLVAGFRDVYSTDYYADAVKWAVDKGITNGTGDGRFSPERTCSENEIMTMIWRACSRPTSTYTGDRLPPASILPPSSPYYAAYRWFCGLDVAGNLDHPCSRNRAAYFLWLAAGHPTPTAASTFRDVKAPNEAVSWAVERGITTGTGPDTFSPEMTCTRAQIVTFLYRAFGA